MNKKGFTLVELLAVIAILAILVIIALPNVLNMFNEAKKDTFLTEAKTISKNVSNRYISEKMKGNNITEISNSNNPLDINNKELTYIFELDEKGNITRLVVSNDEYCIVSNKDYNDLTKEDIKTECTYEEIHNIAGTLTNKYYEKSGRTDRSLVNSIAFYSDGRKIEGAESYDVSEENNNSVIMYIKPMSESSSLLDITIVGKGKIALPSDSTKLFSFYYSSCIGPVPSIYEITFNNSIDTSKVTNMSYMFYGSSFKKIDVSDFDTSSAITMKGMFYGHNYTPSYSESIIGLNNFDTSKVTDMSDMFNGSKTTMLDVSGFNTSNVTNMSGMFSGCNAAALNLSSFNTSKVTDMSSMFNFSKVKKLDLNNFDTSNVTKMNSMFSGINATEIEGLTKFNTSKVTNMNWMFYSSKVEILDLSSFDTRNVTDMSSMFYQANTLKAYVKNKDELNKFNNVSNKPSALTFTVK